MSNNLIRIIEKDNPLRLVNSKLEKDDYLKYKILNSSLTVECDLKENRANYILKVNLMKKVNDGFIWFNRFDKDTKARFIGVNIEHSTISTQHDTKFDDDGNLYEISLIIPYTEDENEKIRFTIRYEKEIKHEIVSKVGINKRMLVNLFNSFASECDEFCFNVKFKNKGIKVNSVISPGEKDLDTKAVKITKSYMTPLQFIPVTILVDTGYYKLSKAFILYIWPIIVTVIGFLLSFLKS